MIGEKKRNVRDKRNKKNAIGVMPRVTIDSERGTGS